MPLKSFIADNFTWLIFWFVIIGIFVAFFTRRTKTSQYVIGWSLAVIPYFMILHKYIRQHNYYQAPFIILVATSVALLLYHLSSILSQLINKKLITRWILVATLVLLTVLLVKGDISQSLDRQFDTQFYTNVAGDYINQNSASDERVWLGSDASGQTYSVLWTAERIGSPFPNEVEKVIEAEQTLKFRWIFLYGNAMASLQQNKPEIWSYIEQNYDVVQTGLFQVQNSYQPVYFLLKKGGNLNLSQINNKYPIKAYTYELSSGELPLYAINT